MLTDVEGDEFGIARGTKQGDPLSSLFFNSVLRSAMERDMEIWIEKGLGIKLSDEKRDANKPSLRSRRAHDGELFETAQKMIADFERSTKAQGLEFHPYRPTS